MSKQVPELLESADYVISVNFGLQANKNGQPIEPASADLAKLMAVLSQNKAFYAQVRPGDNDTLLVFVRANDKLLLEALKDDKVRAFIYGDEQELHTETTELANDLTETERLRLVYQILTYTQNEGGLHLTPGVGEWSFIKKISPIYTTSDLKESGDLLKSVLAKPFVTDDDIDQIKDFAGEEVGLYFHFLNHYFNWLVILAGFGLISHLIFGRYSVIYTVFSIVWGTLFINSWDHKQFKISLKWNTREASSIKLRRSDFKGESNEIDPITNEFKPYYPEYKRSLAKLGFVPIALISIGALFTFQFSCFLIEIFLTEIYQGPLKPILGLVPTVLLVVGIPIFTKVYQIIVNKYLPLENHEYEHTYRKSSIEKSYIYSFLAQYSALFITILFYIPLGYNFNAYLPWIYNFTSRWGIPINYQFFKINQERLITQYNYFIVTNQVIGLITENILPEINSFIKNTYLYDTDVELLDTKEEAPLLKSVRDQISKPVFDVTAEYKELSIHFGYIILFSPIWSLAPLVSLFFLWIEFRGDLYKLFAQASRPIPNESKNSKPWPGNFKLLTFFGSVTASLITFMFQNYDRFITSEKYSFLHSAIDVSSYRLFFIVFVSENLFVWGNHITETLIKKMNKKSQELHSKKSILLRKQQIDKLAVEKNIDEDFSLDVKSSQWAKVDTQKLLNQAATIPTLLKVAKEAKKGIENKPKEQEITNVEKQQLKKEAVNEKSNPETTTGSNRYQNENEVTNRKVQSQATTTSSSSSSSSAATNFNNVPTGTLRDHSQVISLSGTPLNGTSKSVHVSSSSSTAPVASATGAPGGEVDQLGSSNSSQGSLNGATLPPNFPLDSASRRELQQKLQQQHQQSKSDNGGQPSTDGGNAAVIGVASVAAVIGAATGAVAAATNTGPSSDSGSGSGSASGPSTSAPSNPISKSAGPVSSSPTAPSSIQTDPSSVGYLGSVKHDAFSLQPKEASPKLDQLNIPATIADKESLKHEGDITNGKELFINKINKISGQAEIIEKRVQEQLNGTVDSLNGIKAKVGSTSQDLLNGAVASVNGIKSTAQEQWNGAVSSVNDIKANIHSAINPSEKSAVNAPSPQQVPSDDNADASTRVQPVQDLKALEVKEGEFTSHQTPKKKKKSVFGMIKEKVGHSPVGHHHKESNDKK